MRDGTTWDRSTEDLYGGTGVLGPVGDRERAVGTDTLRADVEAESTNT